MAVRIQNGEIHNFGTWVAGATATHGRLSIGSARVVRPLSSSITVAAGGQAQIDVGEIDIVIPSNQLSDAFLKALIDLALNGTNEMDIDLMTSSTAVVSSSGYSQRSSSDWDTSEENDS